MARKRKSRASEALQEHESEQALEPETIEPEHPVPEQDQETHEDEPEMGQEVVEDQEQEEEEEEEEEEGESEGEEDQKDNAVVMENHQESELAEKPSDNGGEADGLNGKEDDELEEEPLEKLLEPFTKDQLTLLIKEAVARHPDVIHNVHKLADADPVHRKIFVHGLGWDANSDTITSVFGKYGEIEDCKVVKDKSSGKSKGYGFILFKHRDGARRALKQPQKLIEGRMASCQLASIGPVQAPPPTVAVTVGPPVSEYTQRKIFVSNVSADVDPAKLVEFFSKFGEIEEGPLGLDKQTGKPRGFCLFVYKSIDFAKKALEEPYKNFEGLVLHCQKAVDGPKHNKGFFNQQHSQIHPAQQQQHHRPGHQGYYHPAAKKGRYAGSTGGVGHTGGHLMAPSAGPSAAYNPGVAPAAIGQAVAALLSGQGAGLGIGNLLGGIGAGVNPQTAMMNNAGYGAQSGTGGYGGQPAMQGGYGGQPQMGQGGVRPHQGGAPYMGHGH